MAVAARPASCSSSHGEVELADAAQAVVGHRVFHGGTAAPSAVAAVAGIAAVAVVVRSGGAQSAEGLVKAERGVHVRGGPSRAAPGAATAVAG